MRIYENIVEVDFATIARPRKIRIWFHRDTAGPSPWEDEARLKHFYHANALQLIDDPFEVANYIATKLVNVNAVEVRHGNIGVLVYPDWP